ncbi:MAG: PH domain-containing protein [Patescibacteria group bacterium]
MLNINHLPNQAPDEEVVLLLRRHIFIILREVALFMIFAGLPLLAWYLLQRNLPTFFDDDIRVSLAILLVYAYELYVWLFFYRAFIDYYLDVWIVTNKRIINIEQMGLFNRRISEQKLFRVQDVSSSQQGFFGTFLDYGDVSIQTAAEVGRFTFEQVPHPTQVALRITELVEHDKHNHPLVNP